MLEPVGRIPGSGTWTALEGVKHPGSGSIADGVDRQTDAGPPGALHDVVELAGFQSQDPGSPAAAVRLEDGRRPRSQCAVRVDLRPAHAQRLPAVEERTGPKGRRCGRIDGRCRDVERDSLAAIQDIGCRGQLGEGITQGRMFPDAVRGCCIAGIGHASEAHRQQRAHDLVEGRAQTRDR